MNSQFNSRHCNHNHHHMDRHSNAFIDLNGIPYILGEYLDKRRFREVNRCDIKSEVNVDNSEAMRAIIDINIDDIGKNASDGFPAIIGNSTKFQNLLRMIKDYAAGGYGRQLNVLRKGIIVRVNYQLENLNNGQVIRSMSEDFRIKNREYFIDINPKDINDNAIIVNFADTIISTVDQFTHGLNQMTVRVTSLELFYETVQRKVISPTIQNTHRCPQHLLPTVYGQEEDMYAYHSKLQSRQYIGYPDMPQYDCNCGPGAVLPPSWIAFNTFYHFDDRNGDIILHCQEIEDCRYQVSPIPAGRVNINRSFVINPGSRLIFKISIWKNDLTVVNDTMPIAQILRIPIINNHHNYHDCHHHETHCDNCEHIINPDQETLIRLYREMQVVNDRQNGMINYMMTRIEDLTQRLASVLPPISQPDDSNKDDSIDDGVVDNEQPSSGGDNQETKDPDEPSEVPGNSESMNNDTVD